MLKGQFVSAAWFAVANGLVLFSRPQVAPYAHVAEGAENGIKEAGGSLNICDADRNVVEQVHLVFAEVATPLAGVLCGLMQRVF